MDLHAFVGQHTHVSDVKFITLEESCKFLEVSNFWTWVFLFSAMLKFSPHRVEHHLKESAQTEVFLDVIRVDFDPLTGLVVCKMFPTWGERPHFHLGGVPYQNGVPLLHGFF